MKAARGMLDVLLLSGHGHSCKGNNKYNYLVDCL